MKAKQQQFKVRVQVLPKADILDPQGQAVENALQSLGYKNVSRLRIGKEVVFEVSADSKPNAQNQAKEMCEKLLANPVIEDYRVEL